LHRQNVPHLMPAVLQGQVDLADSSHKQKTNELTSRIFHDVAGIS
jgi:hypothetical protein